MTWLLILARLKSGLSAAFWWIRSNPSLAIIIGLSVALAWTWHGRSTARADLAQHIAAEKAATGAQKRVNDAAQVHYERKADEADNAHADMVAEAFDSTARFIQSHRLQGGTCKAPAPATSEGASVSPEVPSGVVVGEADVQTCADLYAYSAAAHQWATSLKLPENLLPEGTAEPNPR